MNAPEISIIIPVYNVEKYVHKCFESIQKQTFSNFEVIIVNDGSTDDSLTVLEKFSQKDSRFKIFTQDNSGPGIARNNGITKSSGKYILFMDPDDWYPNENVLKMHIQKKSKTKCHISGGSMEYYDESVGKIIPNKVKNAIFTEEKILDFTEYQYDYFFQRFMYDADFLKSKNITFPPVRRYQDVLFFLNAMKYAKNIYCFSECTYSYRGNNHEKNFFSKEKTLEWLKGMKEAIIISKKEKWHKIHYKTALQLTYDNFLCAGQILRQKDDEDYNKIMEETIENIDWKVLQTIDQTIDPNYPKYKIQYGCYLWDVEQNVNEEYKKEIIKKLIQKLGITEFTKIIVYNYLGTKEKIVSLLKLLPNITSPTKIKTIGIFNESLNIGGVERCVSLMIPMFKKMGYDVVLLTETTPDEDKFDINSNIPRITLPGKVQNNREEWIKRVDAWCQSVLKFKIDVIYYNSYWKENIVFDSLIARQICKIPFIIHHHNVFSAMLARNNDFYYRECDFYSFSNCIISLSTVDELYYRCKGLNSLYIPNPTSYFEKINMERDKNKIIWVGRFVPNHKQPIEAIKIMEIIHQMNKSAKLYMIGDGEALVKKELVEYCKDHKLEDAVIFTGFLKDMQKEYATASVMLMTSCIEGFPMAVSECKSQGLPLVAYDLPYVEMIKDSEGVIRVPQGDITAAANAVYNLLKDEDKRKELSEKGIKSLENYNDDIIMKKWKMLFDIISKNDYSVVKKITLCEEDVSILLNTIHEHAKLSKQNKKINQPQYVATSTPIIRYVTKGVKGLLNIIFKKEITQTSKVDELLFEKWKKIEEMGSFDTNMILNAGNGARIAHNLSLNDKKSPYHLPLDSFGEYELNSTYELLVNGAEKIYQKYSIIKKDEKFTIIRDDIYNITSRRQFTSIENIQKERENIIAKETREINKLKESLSNGAHCTIIMCNRKNLEDIIEFSKKMSETFDKSTFAIIVIYNYPELSKDILYKDVLNEKNLWITRVAMNDNSEEKWKGNEKMWTALLNNIHIVKQ